MRLATLIPMLSFVATSACGGDGGGPTGGGQVVQPTIPAARSGHAMAYDPVRRVVLMFGGSGSTLLGDLWSWDGARWSRLAATGPQARDDAILAFDAARQRLVLFGGRAGQTLLNDTWEWDGTAWSQKSVAGPDARMHAVGAFDAQRNVVRIYGGVGADDVVRTDTWEWNGTAWTRVSTSGPADQGSNAMAYDGARQRTVLSLYARTQPNADRTYPSGLWEWSGSAWVAVAGTGPTFSPVQPMTNVGSAGGLLLVDGGVIQGTFATWAWQNGAWSRVATAGPSLRNGHGVAYDASRNRVVLFGGFRSGQDFNDTWEWNGTAWSQVTPQ